MRIISGKFRGRRFYPPKNNPARPTTDMAKEGLFNLLSNQLDLENQKVLDLFGGTGSISYEFASRGSTDITIVERHLPNVNFIKKLSEKLEMGIRVVKSDVFKFIEHCEDQFDIIFAGPPYAMPRLDGLPDLMFEQDLLKDDGFFILEHNPDHSFEHHDKLEMVRNYGTTIFSIFKNQS